MNKYMWRIYLKKKDKRAYVTKIDKNITGPPLNWNQTTIFPHYHLNGANMSQMLLQTTRCKKWYPTHPPYLQWQSFD